MSTYQYYEFLALDRPLDPGEMAELREMSSRATITPRSFVNTYHWGDLKGDPGELMEQYFDAFLYTSNFGSKQLMFRVPSKFVSLETAQLYCNSERATAWVSGEHLIVGLSSGSDGGDWDDLETGEGELGSIVPARAELMAGDLDLLYLGWLLSADSGMLDDDELEPPMPPGLAAFTGCLQNAADFLRLDPYLLLAAVEGFEPVDGEQCDDEELSDWIAELPVASKDELLLLVAQGREAQARSELIREFRLTRSQTAVEDEPRSVGELLYRAAQLRQLQSDLRAGLAADGGGEGGG